MQFTGPYAGYNPLNSHRVLKGEDDPALLSPAGTKDKLDPYQEQDPRKWDPSLIINDRHPLVFSYKLKPDENSTAVWPYSISQEREEAKLRPPESYSKERLGELFTEPSAHSGNIWLSHHVQFDPSEALTDPERGYKRGKDRAASIDSRLSMYEMNQTDIKAHDFNPRNNSFHKKTKITLHPTNASVTSSFKNNRPDKTEVTDSMPAAYRPPIYDEGKDVQGQDDTLTEAKHNQDMKRVIEMKGAMAALGILIISVFLL